MNRRKKLLLGPAALAATGLAATAGAPLAGAATSDAGAGMVEVTVKVENLAPEMGTLQTPFWVALHDGTFDSYDRGEAASAALERLAEDGDTMPIAEAFAAEGDGTDRVVASPDGPFAPGAMGEATFMVDPSVARYLSYASMVIPSNDAFVANGDPQAHELFDADGNPNDLEIVVMGSEVLDAGTEVNDEVPENTAALAQAAPDTGETEGGVVSSHPGFAPDGNVLAARPAGDFTAEGYQMARITVTVEDGDMAPVEDRDVVAYANSVQEVPRNSSDAWGWSVWRIREGGSVINFSATTFDLQNPVMAHLHLGARGENGPIVVDLTGDIVSDDPTQGRLEGSITGDELVGPLEGMTMSDLVAAIDDGLIYLNIHTDDGEGDQNTGPGDIISGEIRGQLVNW